MIWVALIGLPALILLNVVGVLVTGSSDFMETDDTDLPGKQWMYVLPFTISLFVLCSSFAVHLMEVL